MARLEHAVTSKGWFKMSWWESLWEKILPPAVLVFLTGLFYFPSLNYPFQFDDIANIAKRFAIRYDNPLERFWSHTRWFSDWLNSLNYRWGAFDPFYYRLFNLAIHIMTGLAVFFLIQYLCRMLTKHVFFQENATVIGFLTAGMFLLHPVQTQTVTYVIQARQEGLATLFILTSLLFYVLTIGAKNLWMRGAMGGLFMFSTLLARGTKELVIVLPFLLLLLEWFFVAEESWSSFKKRLIVGIVITSVLLGFLIYLVSYRFAWDALTMKITVPNNRGNILTGHAYDLITPWRFFISEFRVIVHYLAIFLWPFDMSVEYDWKLVSGFLTPQVIVPAMMLGGIALAMIRSMWQKKNTAFTFGLLWFFVAIAPRSTIIPAPELVYDYKTYLASVGIFFLLSTVLTQAFLRVIELGKQALAMDFVLQTRLAALSVMLVALGFGSYQRNKVWETAIVFWEDNVRKAPNKARVHNNLGVALSESGRFDESIVCYQRAISLDSYYADPYSNLAVAYSMKNETDKAIEALRSAVVIYPNYPEAYNNLGSLLMQKKQYAEAEHCLKTAIELRGYYGKAHYNMARLHEERGDNAQAWESLKLATRGDLDIPEVYFKFGQMSLKIGKYVEAVQAFEWVVAHSGMQEQVQFNLANAYYMTGKQEQAKAMYEQLVRLNPQDARYTYNLAEAYFSKGDFTTAYELFRKGTTLPQPLAQTFFRTAHCLEHLKRHDEARAYLESLRQVDAPEAFKQTVQAEITRFELQHKVNQHGGKGITVNEMKAALAAGKGQDTQPNKG